jgi:hypothetical protein
VLARSEALLFVNKKKQKNFFNLVRWCGNACASAHGIDSKKFLGAFFKKHCLPYAG